MEERVNRIKIKVLYLNRNLISLLDKVIFLYYYENSWNYSFLLYEKFFEFLKIFLPLSFVFNLRAFLEAIKFGGMDSISFSDMAGNSANTRVLSQNQPSNLLQAKQLRRYYYKKCRNV